MHWLPHLLHMPAGAAEFAQNQAAAHMGTSPTLPVAVLALLSALNFASGLVLTQRGLRHVPPLLGACISVSAAALLMLALAPLTLDMARWHPAGATVFALIGCLFPATVTLLTFEANRRIGANLTGALGNSAPLFAVLFAFLVLGEIPRSAQVAATIVIVMGVAVLFGGGPGRLGATTSLAMLLPLAAAAVRGVAQPAVKVGMAWWPDPFAASLIGYLVSAAILVGGGMAMGTRPWAAPVRGWMWFSAVGLCNGTAVVSMYAALARGPVATVAPLIACYPVLTLALLSRLRCS